jgi:predicted CXXCH cytochrome family protein
MSGRDYNGLIESACFQSGTLSCLSCHSMHESDPVDQLNTAAEGNEACLQCHETYRDRIEQHTHHPEDSAGSTCYNCHMPHTVYGLLKSIRSHYIDSPDAVESSRVGRPNACNLCHLDRSHEWTANYLSEWYGYPPAELSADATVAGI